MFAVALESRGHVCGRAQATFVHDSLVRQNVGPHRFDFAAIADVPALGLDVELAGVPPGGVESDDEQDSEASIEGGGEGKPLADDAPPPLPPPLEDDEDGPGAKEPGVKRPRRGDLELEDVEGAWGVGRVTRKHTGRYGGFQGSCKHHKLNARTGCKMFFRITGPLPEDEAVALRAARHWLNHAANFARKRDHFAFKVAYTELPDEATVEAQCLRDPPDAPVLSDEQLDAMERGDEPPLEGGVGG